MKSFEINNDFQHIGPQHINNHQKSFSWIKALIFLTTLIFLTFNHLYLPWGQVHVENAVLVFGARIEIVTTSTLSWEKCDASNVHVAEFIVELLNGACNGGSNIKGIIIRYSCMVIEIIVRRAGLLWSQQDFEWRWSVPLFKCLTVLEFSFILFDLCLLITFFNFIMNYVPIVTFWIFTYHKIWILSIMFCFIWSYWIIYFLTCLEVSWRVLS